MAALVLKQCPFCGGKAEFRRWANPKHFWAVVCTGCAVSTEGIFCKLDSTDSKNKTIQAELWNRRVGGDMLELIDYCRSINCWVLQLRGDPAWQPDIVQANRERIAAMQCQSCRAWQYHANRQNADSKLLKMIQDAEISLSDACFAAKQGWQFKAEDKHENTYAAQVRYETLRMVSTLMADIAHAAEIAIGDGHG